MTDRSEAKGGSSDSGLRSKPRKRSPAQHYRDAVRRGAIVPQRLTLARLRAGAALAGNYFPADFTLTCPATGEPCRFPFLCAASDCHSDQGGI